MHILLTGAQGFIGRSIHQALRATGHTVRCGLSPRAAAGTADAVATDFACDTTAAAWRPRLAGIDAVVNTVGVLRDTARRPIDAIHHDTPIALFDACAQAGVRRVVQISALGVEHGSTRYATTKRAADAHLLALQARGALSAVVVRPSIVFGRGGASSALFMQLARLPVLSLPRPVLRAQVQPVAVGDLADGIAALLGPHGTMQGTAVFTGPQALSLAGFIASLRRQTGHGPARILALPDWLTQLSARAGDLVPVAPWCSETLALLQQDNVGDAAVLCALIGREAVHPDRMVATAWGPA